MEINIQESFLYGNDKTNIDRKIDEGEVFFL